MKVQNKQTLVVFEFFATFSKFEATLKVMRCGKKSSHGGIEVDWRKATALLKKAEIDQKVLFNSAKYLWSHPPRKQIMGNHNRPGWDEQREPYKQKDVSVELAIELIKRVRNNLFHGGKAWHSEYGPTERDSRLLVESRALLLKMLELNGLRNFG